MKRLYILLIFIAFGITAAQGADNKKTLQYHHVVLKEKGDTLVLSFDLEFNPQGVKKNQSLIVIPTIKAGNQSMEFPYLQFDGKVKKKALNRTFALGKASPNTTLPYNFMESQPYGYIHYYMEVPYEEWMNDAELYSNFKILGCANCESFYENNLGVTVELMPAPPAPVIPPVIFIKPRPVKKERNMSGSAFLDFRKGSYEIDPAFRNNPEELRKIMASVYQTRDDADISIHAVIITGYASPEGSFDFNFRLSQNRANSLKGYIQRTSTLPAHLFTVASGGEDWVTLKKLVEESSVNQKDRILSIIDNSSSFDQKEQQLKALGGIYHTLLSDFFPALRRVDYQINYTVRDYSITESEVLLNSDPSKLSTHELFLLAEMHERDSEKWNEIILLTYQLNPTDPEATINAAAVYINQEEYAKAKQCLDKVRNNPAALNNIQVYEELEKNGLIP